MSRQILEYNSEAVCPAPDGLESPAPDGSELRSHQSSRANRQAYNQFVTHDSPYPVIKRLIDLKEAGRVIFRRRLEQLDGVAQAVVTGGLEREILVNIKPGKLIAYNISFKDIEIIPLYHRKYGRNLYLAFLSELFPEVPFEGFLKKNFHE